MKHDDESGAWGTYEDDISDAEVAIFLTVAVLALLGLGFVAGWMVFG